MKQQSMPNKKIMLKFKIALHNIIAEQSEYLKNFIDSNLESKSSILALFQAIKGENILNLNTDLDYYKKVSESFEKNWPESYTQNFYPK